MVFKTVKLNGLTKEGSRKQRKWFKDKPWGWVMEKEKIPELMKEKWSGK
jgi:hypothetical protein